MRNCTAPLEQVCCSLQPDQQSPCGQEGHRAPKPQTERPPFGWDHAHTLNEVLTAFQHLPTPSHHQPASNSNALFIPFVITGNFSKLPSLPAMAKGNIICGWRGETRAVFDEKQAWIRTNESRFNSQEVLISYRRSGSSPERGLGRSFPGSFLSRRGYVYTALHVHWGRGKAGGFILLWMQWSKVLLLLHSLKHLLPLLLVLHTEREKKNKIISWFVILPDFQHYYEVDCSKLIQSKTIWWQKVEIFQIHTTAQPQQNTTGRRRGSSFTCRLSSLETSKAYHKNRRDSISKPVAAPFSSQIATSSLQQSNWNDAHLFCHNLCIYPLFPKSHNMVLP